MSPPLIDLLLRAAFIVASLVMFGVLVWERIKHPPKNGISKQWEDVYDPESGTGDRRRKPRSGGL